MGQRRLPSISLFSGAMGLDLGLERAGIEVRVAVECNQFALETIRANRPKLPVIGMKIEQVPTSEILKTAGLKVGEAFLVSGGPSCQSFSTAGQRTSLEDPRGVAFREFIRVVREARPRFFVMENVRGVLSAAVRHRPLKERGPGYPALDADEELGSAFCVILSELAKTGYHIKFDLVNAADYGVPQVRHRLLFIGSRDREPIEIPSASHSETRQPGKGMWRTLRQGLKALKTEEHTFLELCPMKRRFLRDVPAGGNWRDLTKKQQEKALGKAFVSWGGRCGFFRRLSWDRPAPALTTKPDSKATMLCHPDELRALSVEEYARLQGFPSDWKFSGSTAQKYIQIGNAVPVDLAEAVGHAIRATTRRRIKVKKSKKIVCASPTLLNRLIERPRTILNPIRMRKKVKKTETTKSWLKGKKRRNDLLKFIENGEAKQKTETVRSVGRRTKPKRGKAPRSGKARHGNSGRRTRVAKTRQQR